MFRCSVSCGTSIVVDMLPATLLILGLGLLTSVYADNRTTLPDLLGPYPVSVTTQEVLTDRWDPLAPTAEKRKLMITVFQPLVNVKSCPVPLTYLPYMPPKTTKVWDKYAQSLVPSLPEDIFDRLQITNCDAASPNTTSSTSPLLIFSPGSGASRIVYDTYNQAFASSGYTVVSIDHTYDALIVEFPDGSVALRNTVWDSLNTSNAVGLEASVAPFIPVRTADMTSILDAIQNGSIPSLEAYANQSVKAIAYGQSLGGNTVAGVVEQDKRFIGMMDWGGNLWDPWVRNTNISVPTAFQASQAHWDNGKLEETWNNNLWEKIKGWSVVYGVNNTQHVTFTDVPLIIDTLGLRNANFTELFGTISGQRLLNVTWAYGLSFYDFVVNGTTPTLLQGPSSSYPDVFFIRRSEQSGS